MDNKNHIYSNHRPKRKDLIRKCDVTVFKSIWKLFSRKYRCKLMFYWDYAYAIECPRIFYLNSWMLWFYISFNLYLSKGRIYCPKVFDQVTCWNYTLANATAVGGCPLSHPQGLIFSPQGRLWQSLNVEQFNLLRLHKMYVFYIPYMKNVSDVDMIWFEHIFTAT